MCKKSKKLAAFILICMLLVTGIPVKNCDFGTKNVYAEMTKLFHLNMNDSNKEVTKIVHIDLNGDGNKEEVEFLVKKDIDGSINTFIVNINGENALTLNSMGYLINVSYLKLSANRSYLYIVDSYDNDCPTVDAVYHYNVSTKKLDPVLTLDTVQWKKGAAYVNSTVNISKNILQVTYDGHMKSLGYIKWIFNYKYQNGKFVLKNNTAKVIDRYHKGNFVANKNITFYKKPGTSNKAFSIKSGTAVKLQKIQLFKNSYYLQFRYRNKTGWIKAEKRNIFKDIITL